MTTNSPISVNPIEALTEVHQSEPAVLETANGVYVVVPLETETEAFTNYITQMNAQWMQAQKPGFSQKLTDTHRIIFISKELVDVETEIGRLSQLLAKPNTEGAHHSTSQPKQTAEPTAHRSIFDLAKSVYSKAQQARPGSKTSHSTAQTKSSETLPSLGASFKTLPDTAIERKPYRIDKETDQQEQGRQGQQQQQEKHQKQKLKGSSNRISSVQASRSSPAQTRDASENINSIFIRFMALMERILGQAEAEAHQLYQKIKTRTDQVDLLTGLIQKINNEGKTIDWSKNPDMLALLDQARAIGVDIPEGKTKWSEEEKRLLKENIQMRKDSMEKITQLERTDMQRYLQEASQCHQARSNVLKLLKEVMDAIIYNLRP